MMTSSSMSEEEEEEEGLNNNNQQLPPQEEEQQEDLESSTAACLGTRHRLQETLEGVPVYGADILVTMDTCSLTDDTDYYSITYEGSFLTTLLAEGGGMGSVQSLQGHTFSSIQVKNGSLQPSRSHQDIIKAIALYLDVDTAAVGEPELEIFVSTGGDFLAYRSYALVEDLYSSDLVEIVVDAHNLNLLSKCSLAKDTSASEDYRRRYRQRQLGQQQQQQQRNPTSESAGFNCNSCADHNIPVVWTSGTTVTCSTKSLYLDDTQQTTICSQGVNLNDRSDVVGPGPVPALFWDGTLDCNGGTVCNPVVLPTCRDALSDIQFGGVTALTFLRDYLGFGGGLNNEGGAARAIKIKAYAHYQNNYCNAFYNPSTNNVYFGDCNCHTWAPLAAVDIVGHEIFHGVTRHSSGLVYSGQSGGLNEANSDIFGTVLEFYVNDYNDPPDFTIAESVGAVLRNMEFPSQRSISSICNYRPGMNVHYSSGVLNKAYVTAVRACASNGCDTLRGCAIVVGTAFLYSNIHGLTRTSDFIDAAQASCNLVDEFFAVRAPATRCTATTVRNFIKAGWNQVGVVFSATRCIAFSTCTNNAPQPTVPPPTHNNPPTPKPPIPSPTPRPPTKQQVPLPTPKPPTPSPTEDVQSPSDGDGDGDEEEEDGFFEFLGRIFCWWENDDEEDGAESDDDSWW